MEQLKELNESLNKLVKGDISLISALGAVQLVINMVLSIDIVIIVNNLGNTSGNFAGVPNTGSDTIVWEARAETVARTAAQSRAGL